MKNGKPINTIDSSADRCVCVRAFVKRYWSIDISIIQYSLILPVFSALTLRDTGWKKRLYTERLVWKKAAVCNDSLMSEDTAGHNINNITYIYHYYYSGVCACRTDKAHCCLSVCKRICARWNRTRHIRLKRIYSIYYMNTGIPIQWETTPFHWERKREPESVG